jgi:hypothetical protein
MFLFFFKDFSAAKKWRRTSEAVQGRLGVILGCFQTDF